MAPDTFEDTVERILRRLDAVQPALLQLQESFYRLLATEGRYHRESKRLEQAVKSLKDQAA